MDSCLDEALEASVRALAAPEAALSRDPYWPKWDSPWWHMTLLWELGEARRIPPLAARAMAEAMDRHYLKTFPFRPGELPPGKDISLDVGCHCALGTMYQVLGACGIDVDGRLPWIRTWFTRYRLPDGGLNCDETVYARPVPRSSVVSTVPVLEAVLGMACRTPEEEAMLDAGAEYLLKRRLFRSLSKGGTVMDEAWLKLTFPRFYHYDVLRGLSFLAGWAKSRGARLPGRAVAEAVAAVRVHEKAGSLAVGLRAWETDGTLVPDGRGGSLKEARAASFALLEAVSRVGEANPWLTRRWTDFVRP